MRTGNIHCKPDREPPVYTTHAGCTHVFLWVHASQSSRLPLFPCPSMSEPSDFHCDLLAAWNQEPESLSGTSSLGKHEETLRQAPTARPATTAFRPVRVSRIRTAGLACEGMCFGDAPASDDLLKLLCASCDDYCRAEMRKSQDTAEIIWDLQHDFRAARAQALELAQQNTSSYVGISGSPEHRWRGGTAPNGSHIPPHWGRFQEMHVLFYGQAESLCRCEATLIAYLREWADSLRNQRPGGDGVAKHSGRPFFLYVCVAN